MNVLICPDSFKGTFTAIEVAETVGNILKEKGINVILRPLADGGEGSIDVIKYSNGGQIINCDTINPVGKKIKSYYLNLNNIAYIEYAKSSGLVLLNTEDFNPLLASSYGFGVLIKDAIKKGFKKIVLTLGGSATNDAGIGMLQALGVKFYNKNGRDLSKVEKLYLNASTLINVFDFDISELQSLVKNVKFEVFSDVNNPLTGENGATKVFGKQKGASESDLEVLENGIIHFSNIIEKKFVKTINFPGAGAAGGVGGMVVIFLNAEIKSGINEIIKILKLEDDIKNSDVIIVGEGSMDYQTAFGKAPIGIAKLAKKHRKIVIGITGKTGKNAEELLNKGLDCILSSYGNDDIEFSVIKSYAQHNLLTLSKKLSEIITNKNFENKIILINK